MNDEEKELFDTLSEEKKRDLHKVVEVQNFDVCNHGIKFLKIKKGLIIIGLSLLLLKSSYEDKVYLSSVSVTMVEDELSYFAKYSLGNVYICKSEEFNKYQGLLEEHDILIIDKRDGENPDMCIYNSCEISDSRVIMEVLLILEEYEKRYPSNWDRTMESMYNEWIVHNICYDLNYRITSTEHVDLDNEDEEIFSLPVWKLLLNRE